VNRQVTFASSKQCEGTKPVKIAQEKSVTPNLLAKSVKIRKWTHVTSSTIMFLRPLMLFCPLTKKRSTTNGPQHRQQQQKVSLSVQASNQHPLSLSFFGCALCESWMIREKKSNVHARFCDFWILRSVCSLVSVEKLHLAGCRYPLSFFH
jgi:hypothetical protein